MMDQLTFTQTYQQAIIGWMMREYAFFQECALHLNADLFSDPKLSEIFELSVRTGKFYRSVPKVEDVKNIIIKLHPKPAEHQPRIQLLDVATHVATQQVSLAILKDTLIDYIKSAITTQGLISIEEPWKKNKKKEVLDIMAKTVEKAKDVKFAADDRVSYTVNQYIQHVSQVREDACTIGNAYFDELIAEGSLLRPEDPKLWRSIEHTTRGSLMKQELTMIVGPTNAGKTTMVSTIMAWNVIMKKKVLYISLEEKGDRIFRNMFQLICNKTITDLSAHSPDTDQKKAIADTLLQEYFFMYEWFKPADMYIEKLTDFIKLTHERHQSQYGKGFDLVVIDYPQHLRSEAMKGNNIPMHTLIANNYIQCKYLANVCKFHCIAPIQSNRGGYVASVRGKENRILDGGDVGGSYDALQIADNVITINRSNEDAVQKRIRLGLVKARNNRKGVTFCSVTDFAKSKTHGPDLPSTVVNDGIGEISPEILQKTLGRGEQILKYEKEHGVPLEGLQSLHYDEEEEKKKGAARVATADVAAITGQQQPPQP